MNKPFGEYKEFIKLTKSAYALADALSSTPEISEIFLTNKNMPYQQWADSIRRLFINMDAIIAGQCMIPIFKVALDNKFDVPDLTINSNAPTIPPQIHDAAVQLGIELRIVTQEFFENQLYKSNDQIGELFSNESNLKEIVDISVYIVDVILGDLGLKRTGLARIYK